MSSALEEHNLFLQRYYGVWKQTSIKAYEDKINGGYMTEKEWISIKNMGYYEYRNYLYRKYNLKFSDYYKTESFYYKNANIDLRYIIYFEILNFETNCKKEIGNRKYDQLPKEIKDCVDDILDYLEYVSKISYNDVCFELYNRAMSAIGDII